jgi:hypothetical protein
MDPFVLQRREEAYGKDASVFRPERWLEADEATKKVMERNLITFGSFVLSAPSASSWSSKLTPSPEPLAVLVCASARISA